MARRDDRLAVSLVRGGHSYRLPERDAPHRLSTIPRAQADHATYREKYGAWFSPYLVRASRPRTRSSADWSPASRRLQWRCT